VVALRAALLTPLALAAAACGSSSTPASRHYLWEQRCAACHSLSPGRPSPAVDAPNLGATRPTARQIVAAVRQGGPGMPRCLAGGQDLADLLVYVTAHVGRPAPDLPAAALRCKASELRG
jgi:mono/diheme cytochrome c family protein